MSDGSQPKRRLSLYIGLLYMLLAVVNIVFFSILIFVNQTDLLETNFKYHSESIVKTVLGELDELRFSQASGDPAYEQLRLSLAPYDIRALTLMDREGRVWMEGRPVEASAGGLELQVADEDSEPTSFVSDELRERMRDFAGEEQVFRARYSIELNEDDYTADLLLPLQARDGAPLFLQARISVGAIEARLQRIYFWIAGAVVWGLIFHALFALFVYRLIFRRLFALERASRSMAAGDLGARARWDVRREDELDQVGDSFNAMAASIQDQFETIQRQSRNIRMLNQEIQAELRVGQEVQRAFLTPLSAFGNLNPAVYSRPLREVSGDIYAVHGLPSGGRAIFFADAAGHGVSAALISAITVMGLEESLEGGDDAGTSIAPARIALERLNASMARRLRSHFYATCIVIYLHDDGRASYASAGHPPALLARPGAGEVRQLPATGLPAGLTPDAEYEEHELELQSGDRLLLYSDGLTESENAAGEEFGIERAGEILRAHAAADPQAIAEALRRALEEHALQIRDDVTLLVLTIP